VPRPVEAGASGDEGTAGATGTAGGDDDVVDAEIVDEDTDRR
jgi:molecular chaperone DnaK